MATEQDRDRRVGGGRREFLQPRVADPVVEQQVRAEAILGAWPAALVRPEPMCQQDSTVDDGRVGEPGGDATERTRAVAVEQDPEDRGGRALVGRPRSKTTFLHEDPGPRGGVTFEPGRAGGRRPAGDQEFTTRVRGDRPDGRQSLVDRREIDARPGKTGDHEVDRAIDVDGEPPARPKVGDLVAGGLRKPAGQRVVATEIREIDQSLARPGDRHDIGGVAVVGQGSPVVGSGCGHEGHAVTGRRQWHGTGAEDHQATGRAIGTDEVAEAAAERCIVGRPGDDANIDPVDRREGPLVATSEDQSGVGDPSLDRSRVRSGGGVQDSDVDRSHPASLSVACEELMATRRVRAYIGLGANLGDAGATLAEAVIALETLPGVQVRGVSRLYATDPVGVVDQPEFRNAVVALDVAAGPDAATGAIALLTALKVLERDFGRRAGPRWGPRELDLDLLIFGRARLAIERPEAARSIDADVDPAKASRLLEVPHREARQRLFVLAPLADLAPRLVPPGWAETVETARRRRVEVEGMDAVRVSADWDPSTRSWVPVQPR